MKTDIDFYLCYVCKRNDPSVAFFQILFTEKKLGARKFTQTTQQSSTENNALVRWE